MQRLYIGKVIEPMEWVVEKSDVTSDEVIAHGVLDPKPSQKLRNHSPDGFAWGYSGSGPAQLALAILLDHFTLTGRVDPEGLAQRYYQQFKDVAIAPIPKDAGWVMSSEAVESYLLDIPEYKS